MNIIRSCSKKILVLATGLALAIVVSVQAQAAVIYVNPKSCTYYPQFNYIKCYYPNNSYKTYHSTNTYKRCDRHGICYWVRCFDYPFYHGCYKYNPTNRVY